MKKFLLVLVALCLWGCSQNKELIKGKTDTEVYQELMDGIKTAMPESVYNELTENSEYSVVDDTMLIGNKKENPTLRLDFTYKDNQLAQYVSKEYGFMDSLKDKNITDDKAKNVAMSFAKTFLNKGSQLKETTALSGYETDNYITLEDQDHNVYLIQKDIGMIIKYSDATLDK